MIIFLKMIYLYCFRDNYINFKFVVIMAKKVKNLFKKIGCMYVEGFNKTYGPVIRCGINPFI